MRVRTFSVAASRALIVALTGFLLPGCGGGGDGGNLVNPPPPPPGRNPASITFEGGGSATGTVGGTLGTPVAVIVRGADNLPLARVTVTFSASAGSLAATSAQTDDNGRASAGTWTLGTVSGTQTVTAQAGAVSAQVTAMVAAGPATRLEIVAPLPASVRAGALIVPPPAVRARDAFNNVVNRAGTTVSALLQTGTASLAGTDAVTDANGLATFSALTVSGSVSGGARTIAFTSAGLPAVVAAPVTLDPGLAATIVLQNVPATARAGIVVAPGIVAVVSDRFNNPITRPVVTVTASVSQGGGTLAGSTATTDTSGKAMFPALALEGMIGTRQLRFAAEQAVAISPSILLFPGDATQLAVALQPARAENTVSFHASVRIIVADRFGNAVGGAARDVTASLASGGGALVAPSARSDAAGAATFSALRLVGLVGPRTLAYASPGLTSATGATIQLDAGPVRMVSILQAPSATATIGIPFAQQPAVQLSDTSGNLIRRQGVSVRAILESAAGQLVNEVATTDAQGVALFSQLTVLSIVGAPTNARLRFGSGSAASLPTGAIAVQVPGASLVDQVTYGDPAHRLHIVDRGQSLPLLAMARDASGAPLTAVTPVYSSANSIVASVRPNGTIVGESSGSAWIRAFGAGAAAIADSVYVTVPRDASAPVVSTSRLTPIPVRDGVVSPFDVLLDTRGVAVGAATILIGLPPELVSNISWQGANGTVIGFDSRFNALRISYVASSGATGILNLARVTLTSGAPQGIVLNREIVITPLEMVSIDFQNLAPRSSGVNIPLVP